MAAYKCDRERFRIDFFYFVCVRLIQTGICVNFVKIIDTQIIVRGFVFYDIVFPEYQAD